MNRSFQRLRTPEPTFRDYVIIDAETGGNCMCGHHYGPGESIGYPRFWNGRRRDLHIKCCACMGRWNAQLAAKQETVRPT